MIITLIAVLHIKFAAMSSIMFCIAANTFLSHYNTIASHMIKHTSLRFLYSTI